MNSLTQKLSLGVSGGALVAAMSLVPQAAMAQAAPGDNIETVTVTGTSIRGVAPVGTNLITVTAADISNTGAQQVQAMLADTPVISGFGDAGEGSSIHNDYYQPSIHNIGASASNATLVLIDGHQPPTGGTNHSTADPNVVPANMIQSIQVIANGDSSIYGSNAVSGVINFITRSSFNGVQLNAQSGFLHGATNFTAGVLSGTSWNGGSAIFAYQYVDQGKVSAADRSFSANPDQTARATAAGLPVATAASQPNFDSFTGAGPNCAQPLVRVNGAGNYYNMVTGQQYGTSTANAPCNLAAQSDLIQASRRNNVMMKLSQDFGSNLTVNAEMLYAARQDDGISGAGTVSQVTTFATGPQANPFFQAPPGYTGAAPTSETTYANLNGILGGPEVYTVNGASDAYADVTAQYRIGNNFVIDALGIAGKDDSYTRSTGGTANASQVDLALNGTTNSGGNTTTPAVAATTIVPLNLPLTTSNALDIWNPAGPNNKTSATVINNIEQNQSLSENISGFQQFRLSTNGTLLDLPAGPLKVAAGLEAVRYTLQQQSMSSNGTGSATTGASFLLFDFERVVRSAFAEMDAPIIGPDMAIPLVQKFEINVSGRYDDYSDVGITNNYKLAFDWSVIDGLKLRGNMSTSFVAPGLDIVGDKNSAFLTANYGLNTGMDGIAIPVSAYPALTQFAPSQFSNGKACTAASGTCTLASTVQGVEINNGDHNAKPQLGRGWEVGFDYVPDFLPGFTTQATYWDTEFLGAITGPSAGNIVNNAGLYSQSTFYPGAGAPQSTVNTAAIGLRQSSALPSTVSYIWYQTNTNWLYLYVQGIDASFRYTFDTDVGTLHVGDTLSELTKYDEAFGAGGNKYSVLNTSGANGSFPSTATNMRANFGWAMGPYAADLFANYIGPYRNWSGTSIIPITLNGQGNPDGGGDPVKANLTVDLHLSYEFSTGVLGDDLLSLTVLNLADTAPPFYLGSTGYDTWSGNPLGREFEIGLTAKL